MSLIKVFNNNKLPVILHSELVKTMDTEHRASHKAKFFDNSKGKVGQQQFGNNLHYMAAINDDWLDIGISNDKIRILLKKTFFFYKLLTFY